MKNFICFMLILCLFSSNLFSEEESIYWNLYIKKIVVEKTKPNKSAWDLGTKKGALPDIFFVIFTNKKEVFKSDVEEDTLIYDKIVNTRVQVKVGDIIKIDIFDKDLGRHDLIGRYVFDIKKEDLIEFQEKDISFRSVNSFVYFFSKYNSLENRAIFVREEELNKKEIDLTLKQKAWEQEKAEWEKEREEARERLGYVQKELEMQKEQLEEKEKELQEKYQESQKKWEETEKAYIATIEELKAKLLEKTEPAKPVETEPAKPVETEPDKPVETEPDKPVETEPAKPVETEPDKPLIPEEEIIEKKDDQTKAEEKQSLPGLSEEKIQKIHANVDRAIVNVRSTIYRDLYSIPYVKECFDVYQAIIRSFLP